MAYACLIPGQARADSSLVLSAADFSTLHLRPVAERGAAARAEAGARLSAAARHQLRTAVTEASGAQGNGRRWISAAFVMGSASSASHVLAEWRRLHRASPVKVGEGGAVFLLRSRRSVVVQVLWRHGARLGLIVLTTRMGRLAARAQALTYAVLADSYLKAPLPRTAWAKVLAQIRPNGSVSEQTALEAFVLSYGPLPGVRVPSGPRTPTLDGDLAWAWVAPYMPHLSRPLRRAIDRAMGFRTTGRGGTAAAVDYGDPGFREDPALTAAADRIADRYAMPSYLGHSLRLLIVAGFTTTGLVDEHGAVDEADTTTVSEAGTYSLDGPFCRIRFGPASEHLTGQGVRSVLAHEVFHCEQMDLDPGLRDLGDWVVEGMAEWAAQTVAPFPEESFQGDYVTTPHKTLFQRTYDAVGFWGHVQDTVPSLWEKVAAILAEPTPEEQYDAADGSIEAFLSTWGSSIFNDRAAGIDWRMDSPFPTGDRATPDIIPGSGEVIAAPYTTSQYTIDATEPLERVTISPATDGLFGEGSNDTDLSDSLFCAASSESDCQCPRGDTGTVPPHELVSFPAALGISGDPNGGTSGTVTAVPLSTYCSPKRGGLGGTGDEGAVAGSGGDPHLYGFGGGPLYDFQQAGEFTLLKSTDDNLDIQVRQQPLNNCCVAFNTALAMRVGRNIVEFDLSRDRDDVNVLVNRVRIHRAHLTLPGGGRLSVGDTSTVTWPDGTTVNVESWYALQVVVSLAADRLGHVEGLLGNASVSASGQFPGADGRRYPLSVFTGNSAHDLTVRYKQFGASWRITQRQSLFDYAAGKSTRSYTVPGFPKRYVTFDSLSRSKRASAKRTCQRAGIASGRALDACVLDVGTTGDHRLATGDARLRAAVLNPPGSSANAAVVPLGSIDDSGSPPRIIVDAAGQGYTSWADGGPGASLDYCRLPQGTTSCASRQSFSYGTGPDQGEDNGNSPVFTSDGQVVLLDGRCCLDFQKFLLQSSDGGQTFTAPQLIVSDDATGMTGNLLDLPPGALFPGSPEQLLSSDTSPDGGGGSIQATGFAAATSDPGWFSPASGSASLSESIGRQGSTLVAVTTNPTSPAYTVSWVRYLGAGDPNAASSWSSPQTFSPAPSLAANAQLAGGPAGIFVARSVETPGDNQSLVLQKFTGSGWTTPVEIASDVHGGEFAVDQTPAGIVYVIWTNSNGALQYAVATSAAATRFGQPHTLRTRGEVEFPQIAVDAQGVGWATWTTYDSQAFATPITGSSDSR